MTTEETWNKAFTSFQTSFSFDSLSELASTLSSQFSQIDEEQVKSVVDLCVQNASTIQSNPQLTQKCFEYIFAVVENDENALLRDEVAQIVAFLFELVNLEDMKSISKVTDIWYNMATVAEYSNDLEKFLRLHLRDHEVNPSSSRDIFLLTALLLFPDDPTGLELLKRYHKQILLTSNLVTLNYIYASLNYDHLEELNQGISYTDIAKTLLDNFEPSHYLIGAMYQLMTKLQTTSSEELNDISDLIIARFITFEESAQTNELLARCVPYITRDELKQTVLNFVIGNMKATVNRSDVDLFGSQIGILMVCDDIIEEEHVVLALDLSLLKLQQSVRFFTDISSLIGTLATPPYFLEKIDEFYPFICKAIASDDFELQDSAIRCVGDIGRGDSQVLYAVLHAYTRGSKDREGLLTLIFKEFKKTENELLKTACVSTFGDIFLGCPISSFEITTVRQLFDSVTMWYSENEHENEVECATSILEFITGSIQGPIEPRTMDATTIAILNIYLDHFISVLCEINERMMGDISENLLQLMVGVIGDMVSRLSKSVIQSKIPQLSFIISKLPEYMENEHEGLATTAAWVDDLLKISQLHP